MATWDYPRWDDAPLPRPVLQEGDVEPLEEEWDRWAARVEHYLSRVEAVCKPDNFIVCGRASVSYDKWAHKMRGIETPVRCSKQGLNAAVQGAAQGTREILTLRRDTARACGDRAEGLPPQKLTDDMLGAVFDEFDADDSGALSSEELAVAISRLGVTMTDAELKELFVEMDSEMTGDIRRHEFINWWKDSIGSSNVEIIHTMEEYTQVMEDAAGTGQLTVLMVGVTYCKPCKAFSKKYGDFAERFSDARFIKVFGNENKDMTTLCDELKVKSTPTFYFFRDDEQVHMHTGANAGKFEKFILEEAREGERVRLPQALRGPGGGSQEWVRTRRRRPRGRREEIDAEKGLGERRAEELRAARADAFEDVEIRKSARKETPGIGTRAIVVASRPPRLTRPRVTCRALRVACRVCVSVSRRPGAEGAADGERLHFLLSCLSRGRARSRAKSQQILRRRFVPETQSRTCHRQSRTPRMLPHEARRPRVSATRRPRPPLPRCAQGPVPADGPRCAPPWGARNAGRRGGSGGGGRLRTCATPRKLRAALGWCSDAPGRRRG